MRALPPYSVTLYLEWKADICRGAALGIAQLYEAGRPHASYFAGLAQQLGIAYTSCIISLEIILTLLICGRIYYAGRRYTVAMGAEVGRAYTSAAAIIVESMLPYSVFGFVYLITLGVNSPTSVFFLSLYVMFTVCASHRFIRTRHALTLAAHR